jgi:hypothetical protein
MLQSYRNLSVINSISSITIWRLDYTNLRDYISEDSSASRNEIEALKTGIPNARYFFTPLVLNLLQRTHKKADGFMFI